MSFLLLHFPTAEDANRTRRKGVRTEGSTRLARHEVRETITKSFIEQTGFIHDPWVFPLHPAVSLGGVPLSPTDYFGPNTVGLPVWTHKVNVYNCLLRSSSLNFDTCRERMLASEMTLGTYERRMRRCSTDRMWMDRHGAIWPLTCHPLDADDRYEAVAYIHAESLRSYRFLTDEEVPASMKSEALVLG